MSMQDMQIGDLLLVRGSICLHLTELCSVFTDAADRRCDLRMRKSVNKFLFLLLVHGMISTAVCTDSSYNISRRHLLNTLLNTSRYDPRIAPDFDEDDATAVTIQLYILSVDSLNEMSMDFSMDVFLRQRWYDKRLRFDNHTDAFDVLELGQMMIDKVWIPDTFFSNEKEALFHLVTVPNKLMHIYRNGTIRYSIRISMTMSCNFQLEYYPFDEQWCPLTLESFGYSTDNVKFVWHEHTPIHIENSELLAQFTMDKNPYAGNCSRDYGEGSAFACLEGQLHFTRNTGYYIIQIFVPSILIVVLSWVSFWLDLEATPARISLGVLTVLTMTTQSSGVRASLPRVSYVKAIDVWMATCLVFVFASLLEFAYINVMTRRQHKLTMSVEVPENGQKSEHFVGRVEQLITECDFKQRARRIDKVSRCLFPVSFLIFNLVFWIYYEIAA